MANTPYSNNPLKVQFESKQLKDVLGSFLTPIKKSIQETSKELKNQTESSKKIEDVLGDIKEVLSKKSPSKQDIKNVDNNILEIGSVIIGVGNKLDSLEDKIFTAIKGISYDASSFSSVSTGIPSGYKKSSGGIITPSSTLPSSVSGKDNFEGSLIVAAVDRVNDNLTHRYNLMRDHITKKVKDIIKGGIGKGVGGGGFGEVKNGEKDPYLEALRDIKDSSVGERTEQIIKMLDALIRDDSGLRKGAKWSEDVTNNISRSFAVMLGDSAEIIKTTLGENYIDKIFDDKSKDSITIEKFVKQFKEGFVDGKDVTKGFTPEQHDQQVEKLERLEKSMRIITKASEMGFDEGQITAHLDEAARKGRSRDKYMDELLTVLEDSNSTEEDFARILDRQAKAIELYSQRSQSVISKASAVLGFVSKFVGFVGLAVIGKDILDIEKSSQRLGTAMKGVENASHGTSIQLRDMAVSAVKSSKGLISTEEVMQGANKLFAIGIDSLSDQKTILDGMAADSAEMNMGFESLVEFAGKTKFELRLSAREMRLFTREVSRLSKEFGFSGDKILDIANSMDDVLKKVRDIHGLTGGAAKGFLRIGVAAEKNKVNINKMLEAISSAPNFMEFMSGGKGIVLMQNTLRDAASEMKISMADAISGAFTKTPKGQRIFIKNLGMNIDEQISKLETLPGITQQLLAPQYTGFDMETLRRIKNMTEDFAKGGTDHFIKKLDMVKKAKEIRIKFPDSKEQQRQWNRYLTDMKLDPIPLKTVLDKDISKKIKQEAISGIFSPITDITEDILKDIDQGKIISQQDINMRIDDSGIKDILNNLKNQGKLDNLPSSISKLFKSIDAGNVSRKDLLNIGNEGFDMQQKLAEEGAGEARESTLDQLLSAKNLAQAQAVSLTNSLLAIGNDALSNILPRLLKDIIWGLAVISGLMIGFKFKQFMSGFGSILKGIKSGEGMGWSKDLLKFINDGKMKGFGSKFGKAVKLPKIKRFGLKFGKDVASSRGPLSFLKDKFRGGFNNVKAVKLAGSRLLGTLKTFLPMLISGIWGALTSTLAVAGAFLTTTLGAAMLVAAAVIVGGLIGKKIFDKGLTTEGTKTGTVFGGLGRSYSKLVTIGERKYAESDVSESVGYSAGRGTLKAEKKIRENKDAFLLRDMKLMEPKIAKDFFENLDPILQQKIKERAIKFNDYSLENILNGNKYQEIKKISPNVPKIGQSQMPVIGNIINSEDVSDNDLNDIGNNTSKTVEVLLRLEKLISKGTKGKVVRSISGTTASAKPDTVNSMSGPAFQNSAANLPWVQGPLSVGGLGHSEQMP